jgi:hypothetical protein
MTVKKQCKEPPYWIGRGADVLNPELKGCGVVSLGGPIPLFSDCLPLQHPDTIEVH